MRSADTDPAAERVQIELPRKATIAQRATIALSLSRTTLDLARRAVWEAHPTDDPDEFAVRWVASCYGPALADGLRRYLEVRRLQRQL